MKPLNRRQVKSLNALALPEDGLEALWAYHNDDDDGRRQVVKVTPYSSLLIEDPL